MPLKAFDTRDAVPEAHRANAIETKDGKFVISEEEDTTGLKNSLKAAREERATAERKAKELESRISTLEESIEAGKAGISGDKLTEIQRKAEEKFQPQLTELEERRKELRELRLDGAVKSLLGKAKAVDVDAAFKVVGDQFDLTTDGKLIVKADPTADVEKYITGTVVTKHGFLFKGTEADGGGAAGAQNGLPGDGKTSPTKWTSEQREKYIEANGSEAYSKLLNEELRAGVAPKPKA